MSSASNARPNESAANSGTEQKDGEARDPNDNPSRTARPAASGRDAAAAAIDEARAAEALEGLKRIRAKARLDKMARPKPAPATLPPAIIVAKPPPPRPGWVAPLAALAVAVGLVVSACTGLIAYVALQPSPTTVTANAEIRNLRETVAQLRRQVSGVSENLDGLRAAVDLSSKATSDRFGRFAENLDRIERVSSSSTAKLDRLAQAQLQAAVPGSAMSQPQSPAQSMTTVASAGSGSDVTGSVSSSERQTRPPRLIKGWSVRQAYEGVAILQGPAGVVEVVLGQDVPGLGQIEEIKNENGRLIVLSSSGVIVSAGKGAR